MGDELKQRTAQLLADYLEYCAREPGTAGRPPSTHEAALLRYLARRIQQRHRSVFSRYQRFRGNRLQLVANAAQQSVRDRGFPTWGRVVLLLTLVGTLLERPPKSPSWEQKEWEAEVDVDSDCRRLVAFLCDWLTVEHRAWLEAQGGWDGFFRFFTTPTTWSTLLAQVFLSCIAATILTYIWTQRP